MYDDVTLYLTYVTYVYSLTHSPTHPLPHLLTHTPTQVRHSAKEGKLSNAGVVSFTLERAPLGGHMVYRIRPDTIRLLHGDFH